MHRQQGKPLANGLGSAVEIAGGHITYVKNVSSFVNVSQMDGLVNTITGNRIFRTDEGLISGEVILKSAFAEMDAIFEAFCLYPLRFNTAEEYLSLDREQPTLMQNLFSVEMLPGMKFPKTALSPGGILPIKVKATAYTEVLGFIEGSELKGTFVLNCDYEIVAGAMFRLPPTMNLLTEGTFELKIK